MLHALDENIIVRVARLLVGGKVFRDDKTLAQLRNGGAGQTGSQFDVSWHSRPPATDLETGIAQQRILETRVCTFVESGLS